MPSESTHDIQRPPAQASPAVMAPAHTPSAGVGDGSLVALNWKAFLWPVAIYLGVHLAEFYFDFALSGSYALPYITIIHSYALMLAAPVAAFLISLRMFPMGYSYRQVVSVLLAAPLVLVLVRTARSLYWLASEGSSASSSVAKVATWSFLMPAACIALSAFLGAKLCQYLTSVAMRRRVPGLADPRVLLPTTSASARTTALLPSLGLWLLIPIVLNVEAIFLITGSFWPFITTVGIFVIIAAVMTVLGYGYGRTLLAAFLPVIIPLLAGALYMYLGYIPSGYGADMTLAFLVFAVTLGVPLLLACAAAAVYSTRAFYR